ncbi:hypothetical protein Hdeb2414_s0021g00571511 [Helianthus debilis subsp. tardiflorus]
MTRMKIKSRMESNTFRMLIRRDGHGSGSGRVLVIPYPYLIIKLCPIPDPKPIGYLSGNYPSGTGYTRGYRVYPLVC